MKRLLSITLTVVVFFAKGQTYTGYFYSPGSQGMHTDDWLNLRPNSGATSINTWNIYHMNNASIFQAKFGAAQPAIEIGNGTTTNLAVNGNIDVGLDGAYVGGYGQRLQLISPSSNTDPLWLSRYNIDANSSELRVNIGDDAMGDDAFHIGYTYHYDNQWKTIMRLLNNGNVGIGTSSPGARMDVVGQGGGSIDLRVSGRLQSNSADGGLWLSNINDGFIGNAGSNIGFWTSSVGWNAFQIVKSNGYVGIGTTSPDQRLTVKGIIHSQEVKVDLQGAVAPDYVFEEDYKLPSLQNIELYTQQHKHLPEVPSAKEMEENGVNLKEMNMILLKKVEELTLHIIEQNKRIEKLEGSVEELSKKK